MTVRSNGLTSGKKMKFLAAATRASLKFRRGNVAMIFVLSVIPLGDRRRRQAGFRQRHAGASADGRGAGRGRPGGGLDLRSDPGHRASPGADLKSNSAVVTTFNQIAQQITNVRVVK